VICTLLQAVKSPPLKGLVAMVIDVSFDGLFLLELILRYTVCPSTRLFCTNPYNLLDVASVAPLAIHTPCIAQILECEEESQVYRALICVVPTIRLLKTLRHFQQFHLFLSLLDAIKEALVVLLFVLIIIVLSFSSLVFFVEPREHIESLPMAMWLIVVTISTVGYGDVTPSTTEGTLAVAGIILSSVLYMAMPIGIIGNAFTTIWIDRHRILLTVRTRDRLRQWGYTAADMQMLFKHFDTRGKGELNMAEFRKMISEMRVGIKDDRVVELFESFDKDGSGGIDPKEFTRALFPSEYHLIYGDQASDGRSSSKSPRTSSKSPRSPKWKILEGGGARDRSLNSGSGGSEQ